MSTIYLIPRWFFEYSLLVQLISAVITLLVSLYSYKIYKISREYKTKLFSYSFFLISLSYWAGLVLIYLVVKPLDNLIWAIDLTGAQLLDIIIINLHLTLFLAGLVTLAYITLEIKNTKVYFLLLALVIPIVVIGFKKTDLTFFMSTILLTLIASYYVRNCFTKKSSILIATSFVILWLASIDLTLGDNYTTFFVGGHVLTIIGYLMIFIKLVGVVKSEFKKKNKA